MALQTKIVELLRGGSRMPELAANDEFTAPSVPDADSLASEASGILIPTPRQSMTQYVADDPVSRYEPEGVGSGGSVPVPVPPIRAWERAAGGETVERWMEQGAGVTGARCLQKVMGRLSEFRESVRWSRTGAVRAVVAELVPMMVAVGVPQVYKKLLDVGLPFTQVSELRVLLLAFIQLETTGRDLDVEENYLIEKACVLRADLMAACTWNLRSHRDSNSLARVTQSVNPDDLALDLVELASLISENAAAFAADKTFCVAEACELARTLACRLRAYTGRCPFGLSGERELSMMVFSLLMENATGVQAAGTYALRDEPHWARAFAAPWNICARRSKLRMILGG
jgi:hypothetical protein